jgi:hypothetical protein
MVLSEVAIVIRHLGLRLYLSMPSAGGIHRLSPEGYVMMWRRWCR